MAARDDTYRNQRWLDIAFAVSCLAMLAGLVWMFTKDYDREFKDYQRKGREVEVALLNRQAAEVQEKAAREVEEAKQQVAAKLQEYQVSPPKEGPGFVEEAKRLAAKATNPELGKLEQELPKLKAEFVRLQDKLAAEKAERDSLISQRDILLQQGAIPAAVQEREEAVNRKNADVAKLEAQVEEAKAKVAAAEQQIAARKKDLTDAVDNLDRLSREHARLVRLAEQKKIGAGAKFRALPIIDAFASPYRIQQHIPDGLLIDYNFKQVQRNDRCATCHMFIDRNGFDKATLRDVPEIKNKQGEVDPAAVAVYCNHPRLDLYVGSNSPHPVEKFGCTVCHAGQGGAATFSFAYHFPDHGKTDGANVEEYGAKRQRWAKQYDWHESLHPDYLWDYPMIPQRFAESACLKCHHQVTDLIRTDGRQEAPKLLKGYRLVRDLGCFGCHEISGFKGGRSIGPDLRLEPFPPLDELPAADRARALADPNDPPGKLQKVGPGLRRIADKTTEDWTSRWIRSPRSFRPDTRMPHFFGLTNNTPHRLSDHQEGESQLAEDQKGLPDAEIRSITFYLFEASKAYLAGTRAAHELSPGDWAREQQVRQTLLNLDAQRRENVVATPKENDPKLPLELRVKDVFQAVMQDPGLAPKLTKEQLLATLAHFTERERQRNAAALLERLPYPPPELKDHRANADNGRKLFSVRGCVACHSHDSVKEYDANGELVSQAEFGPNLSNLKPKLGNNRVQAEKWLYYWLTEPKSYHAQSRMPNPQLEPGDRADIAAFLLGPGSLPPPEEWKETAVSEGDVAGLARVYLEKALPHSRIDEVIQSGLSEEEYKGLFGRPDADERVLVRDGAAAQFGSHADRLKYYVGRKSINRYGCYACHDIPGFESAKPIGTPLNDWGKKDSDRLAFENILQYVEAQHHGHYDPFFKDALESARRDGFLHQKLKEPRSYDYGKFKGRPWDDRLKMPQFKFAHPKPRKGESPEDFQARAEQEEHEAVEAVMTFVLGLVAEPVPLKFVNQPRTDRQHEVKGLQLLEKYNCVGCHTTKPGSYEFALDEETLRDLRRNYNNPTTQEELARDPAFPEHSAWRSKLPYPPDRVVARGLPLMGVAAPNDEGKIVVELWEAIRFPDGKGGMVNYPAGLNRVQVPVNPSWQQHGPTGGAFAEVLARILAKAESKQLVGDRPNLMGSIPPVLFREGQKVQPQWLFEFLQSPHEIRPSVARNLRMPRFNMSRDDAEALVNYFIAVDRILNPAVGTEYFVARPQAQDPDYQRRMNQDYRARLAHAFAGVQGFDASKGDYFDTGWRLLTDKNLCLKCHDIGAYKAEGKPEEKGPSLHMAADRLRPDYIERWVSMPKRLVPYTLMPQYEPFYAGGHEYVALQAGLGKPTTRAALAATALLDPTGATLPLLLDEGVYHQVQADFVLTPQEKTRAVRDALMSWGSQANPPPTARQAGPRANAHRGDGQP
jgi:mono/diheme cytochrome c family protein